MSATFVVGALQISTSVYMYVLHVLENIACLIFYKLKKWVSEWVSEYRV